MSELVGGRTDYELMARGYPFIVRRNPQPIPAAAIDAQPAACALINLEWLAHIAGAIEALNQPDAWQGTDEEIYNAQQQLEQLAAAFSTICEMSQGANVQFRQTDCTLEVSEDGGATWTEIFNAGCAKTVITYNPDTGYIEADGEPVVSGDTIINNTIIVDNTDGIAPPSLDKRCDVASYYADLMLPSYMAEIVTTIEQTSNNKDALSALIGFAVAVTGIIFTPLTAGTSALAALGYIFAGFAVAETFGELSAMVSEADAASVENEMTPQFWQDVKCKIYCILPNDGIVTPDVQQDIADNVETLTASYPNAIPILAESIRQFSIEAIGRFNIFGALYDGSNCDLCACGGWIRNVTALPYTTKYAILHGSTAHVTGGGAFYDAAETVRSGLVTVEIDLSKTPAWITGATAKAYTGQDDGDADDYGYAKVEIWDMDAQSWVQVYTSGLSKFGADVYRNWNAGLPGQPVPILTTKIKFELLAWGINAENPQWVSNRIHEILLYGAGIDVFTLELNEFNGV